MPKRSSKEIREEYARKLTEAAEYFGVPKKYIERCMIDLIHKIASQKKTIVFEEDGGITVVDGLNGEIPFFTNMAKKKSIEIDDADFWKEEDVPSVWTPKPEIVTPQELREIKKKAEQKKQDWIKDYPGRPFPLK